MKRILTLIVLFFFFACSDGKAEQFELPKLTWTSKTYVYCCADRASGTYHKMKDCKMLCAGKEVIVKTTLDSAKRFYGKRACSCCK